MMYDFVLKWFFKEIFPESHKITLLKFYSRNFILQILLQID